MRAAMYYNNNDVRIEELPTPKIGSKELLVKVIASGICGSDVMEWYRIKRAPLVLGHEITGEIVEVGDEVEKYKVRDRVFVSHHVPCNTCHYCLKDHHTACETLRSTNFDPGGFSEYIRVPEINLDCGVFVLPDNISFEEGTFVEPLGCVIRGQRIAELQRGNSVLIIGSGISGLLHVKLARANGAGKIIAADINLDRLKAAEKFGADATIDAKDYIPSCLLKVNDNKLVDIVTVCTGAQKASLEAFKSVNRTGTVLFFTSPNPEIDTPININYIWSNDITIKTSYAASPKDISEAIEMIANKKIKISDMITHELRLDDAARGFKLVADGKESIKVIIKPHK